MKKISIPMFSIIIIIFIASIVISKNLGNEAKPNSQQAISRIEAFVEGINYNNPEVIYEHLLKEYQDIMKKDEFAAHWNKERSYPYLTPLFIYVEDITFSQGFLEGEVRSVVAARLPGEYMYFTFKWQEDNYYIDAFSEIIDGSYLEKFDKL